MDFLLVFLFAALPALALCESFAALPPKTSVVLIGNATSTIPNIYRDGGGGGVISGNTYIWFADTITTKGGEPNLTAGNFVNFTSNSIAQSNYLGQGPSSLQDFSPENPKPPTPYPVQAIPFFYADGENDSATGIWPNQNLVTLCNGACAIGFPPVISRIDASLGGGQLLYNTGVNITVDQTGRPEVSRPVRALFNAEEPQFGSFSAFVQDEFIYMLATININTAGGAANGLKIARVPVKEPFNKSKYTFWNGQNYIQEMPKVDDGGAANILNWTTNGFGKEYGPSSGEIFYSKVYGVYIIIFGPSDAVLDINVYMSYSKSMTGGWSTPISIYKTPKLSRFNYAVNAYPTFDPTGKVIPISWTQSSELGTYNAFANITIS